MAQESNIANLILGVQRKKLEEIVLSTMGNPSKIPEDILEYEQIARAHGWDDIVWGIEQVLLEFSKKIVERTMTNRRERRRSYDEQRMESFFAANNGEQLQLFEEGLVYQERQKTIRTGRLDLFAKDAQGNNCRIEIKAQAYNAQKVFYRIRGYLLEDDQETSRLIFGAPYIDDTLIVSLRDYVDLGRVKFFTITETPTSYVVKEKTMADIPYPEEFTPREKPEKEQGYIRAVSIGRKRKYSGGTSPLKKAPLGEEHGYDSKKPIGADATEDKNVQPQQRDAAPVAKVSYAADNTSKTQEVYTPRPELPNCELDNIAAIIAEVDAGVNSRLETIDAAVANQIVDEIAASGKDPARKKLFDDIQILSDDTLLRYLNLNSAQKDKLSELYLKESQPVATSNGERAGIFQRIGGINHGLRQKLNSEYGEQELLLLTHISNYAKLFPIILDYCEWAETQEYPAFKDVQITKYMKQKGHAHWCSFNFMKCVQHNDLLGLNTMESFTHCLPSSVSERAFDAQHMVRQRTRLLQEFCDQAQQTSSPLTLTEFLNKKGLASYIDINFKTGRKMRDPSTRDIYDSLTYLITDMQLRKKVLEYGV